MTRSLRGLIVLGAVTTLAACSDVAPTAPGDVPAATAAENLVAAAAPAPSGSCTVTPTGTGYDVTVSWFGFSPSRIELWQVNATEPIAVSTSPHAPRKGSLTYSVQTAPDYALVVGSQVAFKTSCATTGA